MGRTGHRAQPLLQFARRAGWTRLSPAQVLTNWQTEPLKVFNYSMTNGASDLELSLRVTVMLREGAADGIRKTALDNWNGSWLDFPRASLKVIQTGSGYSELDRSGVYLLVSNPDVVGARVKLYIGQTQSLRARLAQHDAGKDFWQRAYLLTRDSDSFPLNQAHAAYLEARLIELAKIAGRAQILNTQYPKTIGLGAEEATMRVFLRNALTLLPLIGINAFVNPSPSATKQAGPSGEDIGNETQDAPVDDPNASSGAHFHLKTKAARGEAMYEKSGFTVLRGAIGRRTAKVMTPTYKTLRDQLIDSGVLRPVSDDELELTHHYTFGSPSTAASVLIGGNVNGRGIWKTEGGQTLAQWESSSER